MTRVWESCGPSGADRMMLLALADNANDEGFCWPSIRTLARKCAVSERAARRTVHRLAQGGYIAAEERSGKSTVYHLQAAGLTPVVDDTPDVDDTPVAHDSPTPDAHYTPPLSPATDEPSKNPHLNPQQQHARSTKQGDGVPAVDGCGAAAASQEPKATRLRKLLPAAAADFKARGELVGLLASRGVDLPVAERLVAEYPGPHVRAMIERGDQEAMGPGWYVRAIEAGYRALDGAGPSAGGKRYTHAQALAWCERNRITLSPRNPLTDFFEVCQESGATFFRLRQQKTRDAGRRSS